MSHRILGLAFAAGLVPSTVLAQPAGIYLAETNSPQATDGSLVNVAAGGSLVNAPRFATNLANPIGACVGPAGHIYVAESATGTVKDATQGGDMSLVAPFAWGLTQPRELWCDGTQMFLVLVSGKVHEITGGGDFTTATPFATLTQFFTSGLTRDTNGTLWLSGYKPQYPPIPNQPPPPPAEIRVVDITNGGDVTNALPHAQIIGVGTNTSLAAGPNGELFLMVGGTEKKLYDATLGGDLTMATPLITYTETPWTNAYVDGLGLLTSMNGIMADDGKLFTVVNNAIALKAHGLKQYVRSAVHIDGCGDGLVDGVEACDDGNALNGDGCSAQCVLEMNGTGGGGMGGTGGVGGSGGTAMGGGGGVGGHAGEGGTPSSGGAGGTSVASGPGAGGSSAGGSNTGGSSAGGSSAGGSNTGGQPVTASSTGGGSNTTPAEDDGCACRTTGGPRHGGAVWLTLAALALALVRMRRD